MIHKISAHAVLFLLAGLLPANSGRDGVDYYSATDLQAKAKTMAANTKTVTHTAVVNPMVKYGNDYTLLVYRNADGLAELHEHESDLYLVVDGEATLVSGGTMIDRKVKSEGEYTASGIQGGQSQVLRKGDVVHISPNLPHQLKVKPGQSFSYFVQKVKEQ
jgi:mannose-6-phosphate isomerase-like protein (cupin superfamily)